MRFKEYNMYSLYRTSEGSKEKNIMETSLTNKKKIVKKNMANNKYSVLGRGRKSINIKYPGYFCEQLYSSFRGS